MRFARLCALALTTLISAVAAHAADPAFTLVVQTDLLALHSSNDHQFTLPLYPGYAYSATVAWGDGTTSELISDVSPTHTYASSGTYAVKITELIPGGFRAIRFADSDDGIKVRELSNWGDVTWATFNGAFSRCYHLQITATDSATARTGGVTDFAYAWFRCGELTSFPLIDTASATTMAGAWSECQLLDSFPLLDTARVTDFSSAWFDCDRLSAFPALDTRAATTFRAAWFGCNGLTHFPVLDSSLVTDFTQAWGYCESLVDFPLLDTARGTDFTQAWLRCTRLASFPLIDTAQGTSFHATWSACYQLHAFPALDLRRMSDGSDCLQGVALDRPAYDALLVKLAAVATATGVVFDTDSTNSYTATAAHDHLVDDLGWTITDGGRLIAITSPSGVSVRAGETLHYQITSAGTTGVYGCTGLPYWLSFDPATGVISGTAGSMLGQLWFHISATGLDGSPLSTTVTLDAVPSTAFTLAIDTRLTGPLSSGDHDFTLPLRHGQTYDCVVHWGDGSIDAITSDVPPTHGYGGAGIYEVSILENSAGGFPTLCFDGARDCGKVLELRHWGTNHWTTLNHAFDGCARMDITADDSATAATGTVTDFAYAWAGCAHLTTFPLLDTGAATTVAAAWQGCAALTAFPLLDTAAVTEFNAAWMNCSALASFPLLATGNGRDFSLAWYGCSSLSAFPPLDTAAATDFNSAWLGCAGLLAFPQLDTASATDLGSAWCACSGLRGFPLLDTHRATSFISTWAGCRGLTAFPRIDTSAATDLTGTWQECSGLTSFPALDTAQATSFAATWLQCHALTSFPSINTSQGRDFRSTWQDCSGIVGFPFLDLHNMTDGRLCFHGVTLDLQIYDNMLHTLAGQATAHGVSFDAGATNHYTFAADHDHLTHALGWTINDAATNPSLTSPAFVTAAIGMPFSYHLVVSDSLGFEVGTLPAWLSYDAGTGIVSGTAPATVGQASFSVTAHGP